MAPPTKKAKTSTAEPTSKPAAPKQISGDSLEEDFILEDGFAQSSDDEGEGQVVLDPAEDVGGLLSDDEDAGGKGDEEVDELEGPPSKKRKASPPTAEADSPAPTRKDKKKKEKKPKTPKAPSATKLAELGINPDAQVSDLGLLPLDALTDALKDKQKRAMPKLSSMELEEYALDESHLLDTSSVPATSRTNLETYIRAAFPTLPSTLAKPPKKEGSPRILVIAGAALRVADLCREVKAFKSKDIDVAKLFSKHFKLAEHAEYLTKTKVAIAVGTPNRIGKLLSDTDALHLNHLSHILLDVSHLDAKKRSLVDMPEAREDLFKLVLGDKAIRDRLREGRVKIALY